MDREEMENEVFAPIMVGCTERMTAIVQLLNASAKRVNAGDDTGGESIFMATCALSDQEEMAEATDRYKAMLTEYQKRTANG